MTETKQLRRLKVLAKRYARANRIAQHQALDLIAGELGFPHWNKFISASKKGWQANSEQLAGVEAFVRRPLSAATFRKADPEAMSRRFAHLEQAEHGMIGNHAYRLQELLHDVIIAGEGWSIRVPENPGAIPIVETFTEQNGECPVLDPEFLETALSLARHRAAQVRGDISVDWPRRSTKPDLDGVVRHPLGRGESDVWFCLHCDGKITGTQIAQNLWHCPGCGASPLDIFDEPFWSDDGGKSFLPVKEDVAVERDEPNFRIVDGRPKLDLNEEKFILLIRSALLDDATNISERLGALLAEISVDDENCAWIALEADLWPEDKEPVQALAVSALLGLEVELESVWSTIPFAWPGLGEITSSTTEYTKMMLDTYAQHGGSPDRKA
ncbi:hypothetical protein ASC75_19210 [Aminobacter sp. DSM 101952]|uniref:hypothetical protein n=1 Tax=Aminobacter sp. DSM 101952 TaxID=2735891 RepID=UPI0006FC97B9|nr:hypothetical protein [Aminobacter sp. DSM 101952]KQU75463.1 hypothetical protein ASC75_19210 [Aminobacter sp. DSM 101952]